VKDGFYEELESIFDKFLKYLRICSTNETAYRILLGKPEGEKPLGRLRYRWVDNIVVIVDRIGNVGSTDRAQDRHHWIAIVKVIMKLQRHKILESSSVVRKVMAPRVVVSSIHLNF
jgi:hypothetical protein